MNTKSKTVGLQGKPVDADDTVCDPTTNQPHFNRNLRNNWATLAICIYDLGERSSTKILTKVFISLEPSIDQGGGRHRPRQTDKTSSRTAVDDYSLKPRTPSSFHSYLPIYPLPRCLSTVRRVGHASAPHVFCDLCFSPELSAT